MKYPVKADQVIAYLEATDGKPMDPVLKMLWKEAAVPLANEAYAKGRAGKSLDQIDYIAGYREINGEEPPKNMLGLFKTLSTFEREIYRAACAASGLQKGGAAV